MDNLQLYQNQLSKSYNDEILYKQRKKYEENRLERSLENQRLNEINKFFEKKEEEEYLNKRELIKLQYNDYINSLRMQREKQKKLIEENKKIDPYLDISHNENNIYTYRYKVLRNIDKNEEHYKMFEKYQKQYNTPINRYNLQSPKSYRERYDVKSNEFYGRRKKLTDVTNTDLYDKNYSNKEYNDYLSISKDFSNYNKETFQKKNKIKEDNIYKSLYYEEQKNKESQNFFKKKVFEEQLYEKKKKILYKNMLDEQINNQIMRIKDNSELRNSSLNLMKCLPHINIKEKIPSYILLKRRKFIDVNPYNKRKYDLGNTSLEYNTIINPKIQFKINKYLFPSLKKSSSVNDML